ncbi:MAG: amidohydrolase [Acidobacteriota bacterium]|nr:amidohydrolase [Blastocatellia bacterium]MDW8238047.1 amidohydrolase [Acidobacteriota bacterium]
MKRRASIRLIIGFMTVSLILPAFGASAQRPSADVVLHNAKIITMNRAQPQAQAIAIVGDRIVAIGSNRQIKRWIGPATRIIDVQGKLVIPGLIESHGHMLGIGQAKLALDLVGTTSEAQIAEMVAARAAQTPPGEWVLGRGWDQNDWPQKQFPTFHSLSRAAPDHPVYLTRIDGHAGWANERAMQLAGLNRNTPDPPGGRIIRDEQGNPTGVLIDRAQGLVTSKIPPPSRERQKQALLLAMQECVAAGLTSFHDAGTSREVIDLYKELLSENRLAIRVYVMLAGADRSLLADYFKRGPEIGLGDRRLTIRAIKLIADGALGSRGAALLEDYADEPGNQGLLILSEDQVFEVATQALSHGFQVCTHAIGDRANRVVLNAYERAFNAHADIKDPRFRIEHAQILDAADIPRFARLRVIASMQAIHCTSDMPWVPDRIGLGRAQEGAYVWQKLLKSGARIANGSDAPVESLNPLWGFYAAVTRQDHHGKPAGGWMPDQRMTREEALRSFTLDAAYAAFDEEFTGSLQVGKLADLVVLSQDIMTVAPRQILQTVVVMTMVAGKIVYQRP